MSHLLKSEALNLPHFFMMVDSWHLCTVRAPLMWNLLSFLHLNPRVLSDSILGFSCCFVLNYFVFLKFQVLMKI